MNRPLAFIDTETDGLAADRRIWEIAIIRREPDGTETEWHRYLSVNLRTADLKGLFIGRFYDRHPLGRYLSGATGTDPRRRDPKLLPMEQSILTGWEAAPEIARLTHGATIIGAVPNFDTEAIANLLREFELAPAWDHRLRCVETLAAGHFGRELGGLKACANELGLNPWDEHTALGDTRAARDIYDAIMTRTAFAD